MGDERDKVLKGKVQKKDEGPDVEAHKVPHASDDRAEDEDPDVEAHKVLKKTDH